MSAFRAEVRAVGSFDGIMLETMAESVLLLYFGQCRKSLAQTCDLFLYVSSRSHNPKSNNVGCTSVVFGLAALALWRFCNLRSSSSWYWRIAFCRASAFSSAVSSTSWFTTTWQ